MPVRGAGQSPASHGAAPTAALNPFRHVPKLAGCLLHPGLEGSLRFAGSQALCFPDEPATSSASRTSFKQDIFPLLKTVDENQNAFACCPRRSKPELAARLTVL